LVTGSNEWIYKNGGKCLLEYYYSNDISKLLATLYPNYPWDDEKNLHRFLK